MLVKWPGIAQANQVAEQYVMLSDLVLCCGLGDLEALSLLASSPARELVASHNLLTGLGDEVAALAQLERAHVLGQRDFDACAEALFGDALKPGHHDRMVLDLMDELPSLDPFLLREQLKRNGFEPARGYFAISDADVERMYAFVRAEVMALVTLSSTEGAPNGAAASRRWSAATTSCSSRARP